MTNTGVKYYTGIGSRDISPDTYQLLVDIGERMAEKGYVLRSGGAQGADQAFQEGACKVDPDKTEIWLPDSTFENKRLQDAKFLGSNYTVPDNSTREAAEEWLIDSGVVKNIRSKNLKSRKLLCRNVYQVVGGTCPILMPRKWLSSVVIYATNEEEIYKKGTRVGVWTGRHFGVPTYNVMIDKQRGKLLSLLEMN